MSAHDHRLADPSSRAGRTFKFILITLLSVSILGVAYLLFGPRPRYNVLLVTLDTTRSDHLGCYGYPQALTPTFDALAKEGVLFESAYVSVPLTLPSHASLLTGLYPPENGIHNNGRGKLDDKFLTLAEILEQNDYETGAFIGSVVLPARSGLNQGFQKYDDDMTGGDHYGHESHLMRSGRIVVDSALRWLKSIKKKPFFCWIHLYDPHAPFEGHPELFQERFRGNEYDGDIAFTDVHVGRLIKHLKDIGQYDRTIIVIVGDHGEGFGEHEELEHGFMLYNATLRVPLIVKAPGVSHAGHRVPTSVSLVDIYPTVLDCLKIPNRSRVSGSSLTPALRGTSIESRPCYSETEACYASFRWAPLQSISTESWKYINSTHEELYDLTQDAKELTNVAESNPDQLARMQELFESTMGSMVICPETDTPISEKDLSQLRALGYLGGNKKPLAIDATERLPDVREMIGFYNEEMEAKKLLQSDPQQALKRLQSVVELAPKFLPARLTLGKALQKLGRPEEAINAYEAAIKAFPDTTDAYFELAKLHHEQGQKEAAAESYRAVLKIDPNYAMAHVNLATILMAQNQIEESRQHFKQGLELSPESTAAQFNYGMFLFQCGDFKAAKQHLTKAKLLDPKIPVIHYQLGKTHVALGEVNDAAMQFRLTLQLNPRFIEAREQLNALQQR